MKAQGWLTAGEVSVMLNITVSEVLKARFTKKWTEILEYKEIGKRLRPNVYISEESVNRYLESKRNDTSAIR